MNTCIRLTSLVAASALLTFSSAAVQAATNTVLLGASGKTFADPVAQCVVHPVTGVSSPMVRAGLFNPRRSTEGKVSLDGKLVLRVEAEEPVADVWLEAGNHTVVVALGRKQADSYAYTVAVDLCKATVPTGNFLSADGSLEYAASGKSFLTVTPGCALNPATGLTQPFVNLFDNGSFLLNVSVNGVALTQLSALRPRAVVFLGSGSHVITAANGALSTDTYVRDGGNGQCTL